MARLSFRNTSKPLQTRGSDMPPQARKKPAARTNAPTAPPYWKVIAPIEGGYGYGQMIKAKDGSEFPEFEINVYDDRTDRGQRRGAIQVQARKTGKFGATAVITLSDADEFEAFVID